MNTKSFGRSLRVPGNTKKINGKSPTKYVFLLRCLTFPGVQKQRYNAFLIITTGTFRQIHLPVSEYCGAARVIHSETESPPEWMHFSEDVINFKTQRSYVGSRKRASSFSSGTMQAVEITRNNVCIRCGGGDGGGGGRGVVGLSSITIRKPSLLIYLN